MLSSMGVGVMLATPVLEAPSWLPGQPYGSVPVTSMTLSIAGGVTSLPSLPPTEVMDEMRNQNAKDKIH